MSQRRRLQNLRRCVIKIGSAVLTNDGQGLDRARMREWVDQMAALRHQGVDFVLVSSGSIVEGMRRLGWNKRPVALYELQAAAAVGQMGLVQVYESCFQYHGVHTAQVLLTHEDFSDRGRYLNARSTLRTLLRLGIVPVVNENDTVATEEIRLGDNDTLSGLVANLVEADLCVILTDQEGLFSRDPALDPTATLVTSAQAGDPALEEMAGEGGIHGRGGMHTKLKAATLAARSGTSTVIASGRTPNVLSRIAKGEELGTFLEPGEMPLAARKRWLAGQLKAHGQLRLDAGAAHALRTSGKSLLPVGVKGVEGRFDRGAVVVCIDPDNREVARGLVNYNADEARKIIGHPSDRIVDLLGYVDEPELIHRDNLVLTSKVRAQADV